MRPDRLIAALATAIALLIATPPARAQAPYPTRPIECIIPFAPGGPTDTAIRLIQPQLSANLGVPLVLVNKAGGGAALRLDPAAKPKPDAYTPPPTPPP